MAENSKIEWTHHTANLWHGCTKVHAGCDHCYAETLSHRWGRDIWGNDKPRLQIASVWDDLKKYQKMAAATGEMHRVFVGSMMDIFEKPMPLIDNNGNVLDDHSADDGILKIGRLRQELFQNISDGMYPNLLFLLLTKRPSNINKYIPEEWRSNPPANVMFGTSPCDQKTADTLIPQLMQVTGKHFLSIEPLLGPIDLLKEYPVGKGSVPYGALMDWIIVGGESGHGARPMHPDWIRSLRDQCEAAEVPFFFKQWGEYHPYVNNMEDLFGPDYSLVKYHRFKSDNVFMYRVGKKAAGRLLDGNLYDQFPKMWK